VLSGVARIAEKEEHGTAAEHLAVALSH
jgi:hypothetical protein